MKSEADISRIRTCLPAHGMSRRQPVHYADIRAEITDRIPAGETPVPYTAGRIGIVLLKRRGNLFYEVKGGGKYEEETGG